MRIRTKDNNREAIYEAAAEALGESTKAGGIDEACQLALDLLGEPDRAHDDGAIRTVVELLEDDRVPRDVAIEIVDALDGDVLELELETRDVEYSVS